MLYSRRFFRHKISCVIRHFSGSPKLGADSIRPGERVKVRCFAQGGAGGYQYAVYCKKASAAKWSKAQDYSTNHIIMFKPAAAVVYDIRVFVRDEKGKTESKTLQLTVTK